MSPVSHVTPLDRPDISSGSVGLLVANMEAKIVDPATGAEIEQPIEGFSGPGELLCRGPNVMVGYLGYLGYLGNPQATAHRARVVAAGIGTGLAAAASRWVARRRGEHS